MNNFFAGIAVAAACTLATVTAHAGQTLDRVMEKKAMVVATSGSWPPQSFLNDDNELVGFDIDVAREIGKRLGVEVSFATPDWATLTGGRWQGRYDLGVGSVTPTKARAQAIDFVGIFVDFINTATKPHDIPDRLRVTVRQLIHDVGRLEEFNASAIEQTVTADVAYDLKANIPPFTGKALLAPFVELGGHSIYAIVKRNVEMVPKGEGKVHLTLGAIDFARVRILVGNHEATASTIEREVEVYRRNATDERIIVLPWRTPDSRVTVRRD